MPFSGGDGWTELPLTPLNGLQGLVLRDHDTDDSVVLTLLLDGGRAPASFTQEAGEVVHIAFNGHSDETADSLESLRRALDDLESDDEDMVTVKLTEVEARAVKTLCGLGTIHLTDYALENAQENGFNRLSDVTLAAGRVYHRLEEALDE